jgi:glycosyltransferase involved in cell wall biosynthesis
MTSASCSGGNIRLVWITNGYAPYRVPLWNAVAELCDLTVLLLADKERFRSWPAEWRPAGYAVRRVPCRVQICVRRLDWAAPVSFAAAAAMLDKIQPEALLLGGYDLPGYWAAWRWAQRRRVPITLWTESTLLSCRTSGCGWINAIKRAFVARCGSFYAASKHSADYLRFLGAPANRIVTGTNLPDVAAFPSAEKIGAGPPALLFAGQLIRRKNLLGALRALLDWRDHAWALQVAGSGPMETELRAFAGAHLPGRVTWLGYVAAEAMSAVYRRADVLLFPSLNEVWGLTVNEALLSGVFVVGSCRAAAARELIEPGRTGVLVDPGDDAALRFAIGTALAGTPYDRAAIRGSVTHLTTGGEASNLLRAVHMALGRDAGLAHAAD